MENVLVISDNEFQIHRFRDLVSRIGLSDMCTFDYRFSYNNISLTKKYEDADWIAGLNVKENIDLLTTSYNVIISLHCKQFFPSTLVKKVRCINVHPGLNPYNRGWFPQVFSIINGLPAGVTIHEIDEQLDHGPIICQQQLEIYKWDTSLSVYDRLLDLEIQLLSKNLPSILTGNYSKFLPEEGNLNLKKDFARLCSLDLGDVDSLENHLNLLRALTHGTYSNAFFLDEKGRKVFVKIELNREEL